MSARRLSTTLVVLAGILSCAAASQAFEIRLLPANTEVVLTVNVKQILASELVKSQTDLIKQVKALAEAALPGAADEGLKYLEKIGFDPMRDLTSVTVAHPGSADPKEVFVILEGTYNVAKLEATAKEAAENNGNVLKISKVGKTTVYEVRPDGNTVIYVGLLGGKSLVFTGSEEALKGAIGRSTSTMIAASKVKDLLKVTNDKQSFSFVMTGKALMNVGDIAGKKAKGQKIPVDLKDIEGISGAVTIGKDIDIMLGVGFKNVQKAQEIAATGMLGLGLVKPIVKEQAQAMPQLEPLVDFMDTIRISNNGNVVSATGSFSNANLQKLFKSLSDMLK